MRMSQAMCLMAMALCFTLTSCEESEQDEEGVPYYNKFVDINITRCERVSNVLMIDFTVTNKQKNDLTVELYPLDVTDNAGTNYGYVSVAFAENNFYDNAEARINGKNTITGHLKVKEFDPNDKAKNVNIQMGVGILNERLADKKFEKTKVAFVDNRVKSHGIQTNDTKLGYKVVSCVRGDKNVLLKFSVTNNTGMILEDFGFGYNYGIEAKCYDNQGNDYNSRIICGNGPYWNDNAAVDRFAANSSAEFTIRVENVRQNATEMSVDIGASADNYICESSLVRILSIPID